jgi:phosphatidylserine/phosphatidylglycerophosphate/cardiolipin synthase-like enzyme
MHNKFVLFCNVKEAEGDGFPEITPYAVWTGSFNFSKNATFSFENAVVLTDQAVVQSYYREWGQILALSEPLNWEDPWCAPEWRIGS